MEDKFSMLKKINLVESAPVVDNISLNVINCNRVSTTDLVKLAIEIQNANSFVHANACNKLQVIAEQIRFLQKQAENIILETKRNTDLHHVACNFIKVPGNIYHLYKRSSGQQYFSMISPDEWNSPHEPLGSFRLEHDQSWTPMEHIREKDIQLNLIDKVLSDANEINVCRSLHYADIADIKM